MSSIPSVFAGSRRRSHFCKLVGIGFGQAGVALATALLVRRTFRVLIHHHGPHGSKEMALIGAGFVVVALVSGGFRMFERILSEMVGQDYSHAVRVALFDHLSKMAPRSLQRRSRGAVVLRFVGDLGSLKRWISLGLSRLMVASITAVGSLSVLAFIDPVLSVGAALMIGLAAIFVFQVSGQLRKAAKEGRRRRSYLAANVNEKVGAIAVVQIFNQSDREKKRLYRQSERLSHAMVERARKIGWLRAILQATKILSTGIILLLGASEITRGRVNAGNVVAAMTVVHLLVSSLRDLGRVQEYRQDAEIARGKILQFLAKKDLVRETDNPVPLPSGKGKLEFENVSYGETLRSISVVAEPGMRIAVVGPNGCGKSTLLWLAARLIDPDSGVIRIDGHDIHQCSLDSLRNAVGMVSPDLPLLRGTLKKNLKYRCPDASDEAIREVEELCELDDISKELSGKGKRKIIEDGMNLSLGQRQRIALARALLGNPRILLLDEAGVHLDRASARIIDRIMRSYHGTVIMVTHERRHQRLADLIWRMGNGTIEVEQTDARVDRDPQKYCARSKGKLLPGKFHSRILGADGLSTYFVYVPQKGISSQTKVLVTVHGIARNAEEQIQLFAPFADQYDFLLIAPLFDTIHYKGYQRLGIRGRRADITLNNILLEVEKQLQRRIPQFYLFGYSGGAQFAHRYMMAYPNRIIRLCIAAAGWYTFPDSRLRFPWGVRPHPDCDDLSFDLNAIVRVPTCVLVGDEDNWSDYHLRRTAKLDARQGTTRIERGQRWIDAMQSVADSTGVSTEYRFQLLPGCSHSFRQCMENGGMKKSIANFFALMVS